MKAIDKSKSPSKGKPGKDSGRSTRNSKKKKVDLFVYGTLMHDQYLHLLINRDVENVPATLYNYMKVSPGWSFPFIVKQNGAKTHGRILKDLSTEEMKILDKFEDEGNLYSRRIVVVRTKENRKRCQCYIGNIKNLEKSVAREIKFEDRYSNLIEKKIDGIIAEIPTDRPDIARRVLRELMSSTVDNIIESHFEGNYICNYIMRQALEKAHPPKLRTVLENDELKPYAGNYMKLACQHIVFNQIEEAVSHQHPDVVRMNHQYFRHGIGILLAFLYYNNHKLRINNLFKEKGLDGIDGARSYRDFATISIDVFDDIYDPVRMEEVIAYVEPNWTQGITPLGAELEFSDLGYRAVYAEPGEDKRFDGFQWFHDFDMYRRAWKLGGHVDSHRHQMIGQKRHRGFLEYALGRFEIVGDLSRPIFDCPWAMSLLINEAVKFLDIAPHSLHVSMELKKDMITSNPHLEEDLVCLLLLGGDIRPDRDGNLKAHRISQGDLDTNFQGSLNFSDRKIHFNRPDQDEDEAADVMEFKFMRLHNEDTDYESLITALKGYQFASQGRPISIPEKGKPELPEQVFLKQWAEKPQAIDSVSITSFLDKVRKGLEIESQSCKMDKKVDEILARIENGLEQKNQAISDYEER